jgi:hypothetical protein
MSPEDPQVARAWRRMVAEASWSSGQTITNLVMNRERQRQLAF